MIEEAVVLRHDVRGPRYTSYPTAPVWTPAFGPEEYARHLRQAAERPQDPLSVYVHVPFCKQMCLYCGCNVIIAKNAGRSEPYLDDVVAEMGIVSDLLGPRRGVNQIHWGGGTPTFIDEAQTRKLFGALRQRFDVAPDAEIAIEVKPADTDAARLALLRELGFNRLSMGVQDFDPAVQAAVGRLQGEEDTAGLLAEARRVGFGSVNFDLIYGLPRQRPETWTRTLEAVVRMRPDRIAAYSFAYVPDLRPHQRKLPADEIPRGAAKLELFRLTWEVLTAAGYVAIGMDHFALPDDPLARAQAAGTLWRNFQGYTVRAGVDTVAFGVTAISDVGGAFAQNVHTLPKYAAAVRAGRLATERGHALSADDLERRRLITDLMCNLSVDLGRDAERRYAAELARLRDAPLSELARVEGTRVVLTDLGRVFMRNVAMVFDRYLPADGGSFSRTV
jgi:oxygen-independent coproporphyrinogen-3 oxidase